MSVTVTDLPDRVVAKVGQGIIDSTLNADRVVVPFFDVELTGNGEWECFLNGNVCGRLQVVLQSGSFNSQSVMGHLIRSGFWK